MKAFSSARINLGATAMALGMLLAWPSSSRAADTLVIPDASMIKYVVDISGVVYLRNLNEIDPTWAGCCYWFWMDVRTDAGRAQFSAFLTARTSRQKLMIYATSKSGSQTQGLLHVGDF